MATQGGPAKAVTVQTGGRQQGGPAVPVIVLLAVIVMVLIAAWAYGQIREDDQ